MSKTPDPYDPACPSRGLIDVIGDKWTLLLLPVLTDGPKRTAELKRRLGGISQKMLTQTLRNLESYDLVARKDYGEVPPRVDYRLTAKGRSLGRLIAGVDEWVIANFTPRE